MKLIATALTILGGILVSRGAETISLCGDSITEGYNLFASIADGGPSGDTNYDVSTWVYSISGGRYTGSNYAHQGWTMSGVYNGSYLQFAQDSGSQFVWVLAGDNDVNTGVQWTNYFQALKLIHDRCLNKCQYLLLSTITPDNGFTSDENATARTWNTNIIAWASTQSCVSVVQTRSSLGNLSLPDCDTLNPAFSRDGVHLSSAGISNMAWLIVGALDELTRRATVSNLIVNTLIIGP